MDAALSSKATLAAAITKLYTCSDEIYPDYLASLFASSVKAIVNDEAMDFDNIVEKIKQLRAGPKMEFSVLDLLRDGKKFAWRHVGMAALPDGEKMGVKTFVLGEPDEEGRVVQQNERVVVFEP